MFLGFGSGGCSGWNSQAGDDPASPRSQWTEGVSVCRRPRCRWLLRSEPPRRLSAPQPPATRCVPHWMHLVFSTYKVADRPDEGMPSDGTAELHTLTPTLSHSQSDVAMQPRRGRGRIAASPHVSQGVLDFDFWAAMDCWGWNSQAMGAARRPEGVEQRAKGRRCGHFVRFRAHRFRLRSAKGRSGGRERDDSDGLQTQRHTLGPPEVPQHLLKHRPVRVRL